MNKSTQNWVIVISHPRNDFPLPKPTIIVINSIHFPPFFVGMKFPFKFTTKSNLSFIAVEYIRLQSNIYNKWRQKLWVTFIASLVPVSGLAWCKLTNPYRMGYFRSNHCLMTLFCTQFAMHST